MPPNASSYRPEIDGLRAVAVLAVLVFHAMPGRLHGGFVGVDVFFVISGFLISRIILAELTNGSFSLLDFYIRRVRRIFPALLFVMAATFAMGWACLSSEELRQLGKHLAAGVGFVSNLVFWSEAGYFDVAAETKPTLHFWSLAVEEQFYLFWPLLLGVAMRRRWSFAGIVLGLGVGSFALSVFMSLRFPSAAYYSPMSRCWELLAGAWLALRQPQICSLPRPMRSLMAALGLVLIVWSARQLSSADPFPGLWALPPVAGACLVIAGGSAAWTNHHLLAARPAVWIGLISYPLYLWHWPVNTFVRILRNDQPPTPTIALLCMAASVAAAWLTFALVEKPLRRIRADRQVAGRLTAAMAAVLLVSAATFAAWVPARNDDPGIAPFVLAMRDREDTRHLTRIETPRPHTRLGTGSAAGETVYIGDSHMEQYRPRVVWAWQHPPAGRERNDLVFITERGCAMLPGISDASRWYTHCAPARDFAYRYALQPQVDKVVLAACWDCIFATRPPQAVDATSTAPRFFVEKDGRIEFFGSGTAVDTALQALQTRLEELHARGKTVYLVLNIPIGPDYAPRSYLVRDRLARISIKPHADRIKLSADHLALRRRLVALADASHAVLLDPSVIHCTAAGCLAVDADGQPFYKDFNHFRTATTLRHADFMDPTVLAAPRSGGGGGGGAQ